MRLSSVVHTSTLALTAAGLISGCVPEFDDDLSRIDSARILAVRSIPAEAAPGEPIQVEILVAAADGQPEHLDRISWAFCISPKPLTELGPIAQACVEEFGSESAVLAPVGTGPSVTATLPKDGCNNFGPLGPPAGDDGISGRPADPDSTGGYYQPLLLGDTTTTMAAPRISCGIAGLPNDEIVEFNTGYRRNENPELEGVHWSASGKSGTLEPGGQPQAVQAGTTLELTAQWAACPREAECGDGSCTAGENVSSCAVDCDAGAVGCTGAESYLAADTETLKVTTRREGMSVAWFATDGTFDAEQTARLESDPDGVDTSNNWIAPTTAGVVTLWVVLRDDRGGVGWEKYAFEVTP